MDSDIPSVGLEGSTVKFRRYQAARVRHQHKLLLHSYKCQQNKVQAQANGKPWRCHVMGCQKMTGILSHMVSCPADKKCSWPTGCLSLRKMMRHYSMCTKEYCPACTQKKEWQMSITEEHRRHILDLMVQMIPRSDSFANTWIALKGHSSFPSDSHLRFMERVAYITAKNRHDYFRILATEKWKIEMDIFDIEKERTNRPDLTD